MIGEFRQTAIVIGFLALTSGCASSTGKMLAELGHYEQNVELAEVPFHPQVTDQCGPAALATILNNAGIAVTAEELKSRVYIPDRKGSLQLELLATTRHYGRIPYVIDPDITAILAELQAGRPVLVMQNLGASLMPIWHYAVVVGYLPDERKFVLRSGDRQRLLLTPKKFLRTWQRAQSWAFVALLPGDLPAIPDADKYLRSVAAVEAVGDTESSMAAYRAATEAWPENDLAWLGAGNTSYASRDLHRARTAYEKVIAINPEHTIALNNLSQVFAELGCRDEALDTIKVALATVENDDLMYRYLSDTLAEIRKRRFIARCN